MNKAQCLKCGDIVESKYLHDFQCCSCTNVCVDGGESYYKRSVKDLSQFKELSLDNNANDGIIDV